MYGFLVRPKWIAFHLLVLGAITSMVWLAFWQLDRLDARREFNEVVSARIEQPPAPFEQLVDADTEPDDVEWRPTLLAGTYLADQILWFNRSQGGLAGDNVLAALVTTDGTTVVVNRGFVPLGFDAPPPPAGPVELLATVRTPQDRQLGELTDNADRSSPLTEIRRIDLDELGQQLPAPLAPVYVDLVDAIPAPSGDDPTPLPPPTFDEGPHLSYAVQWFIFAGCVLIGWVLAVRRSLRTRRRRSSDPTDAELNDATPGAAATGSDRPAADASTNSTPGTASPSPH